MIATTAEVINRVYPVMKQNNPKEILGTVFSIREKEKEFLITAYHVAEHAIEKNTNKVGLIIGTIPLGTRIYEKIIYIDEELDIIILEAPKWMHIGQLSLTSTPEMILGQDVMWMGYPDGWSGGQLLGKTHTYRHSWKRSYRRIPQIIKQNNKKRRNNHNRRKNKRGL